MILNTSTKVLITGASGLLGRQVYKIFKQAGWEVIGAGLTRAKPPIIRLDLVNADAIAEIVSEFRPSVVIHCAANRYPDKCDSDKEGTCALNITASQNLASVCAAHDIFLLYLSTDYVFSGRPGHAPYEADSKPEPSNFYGETKLKGEQVTLAAYENARKKGQGVVLRVPVLYGEATSNKESAVNVLMDRVWDAQKEERKIQMDHWAIRHPTNTEDVARVCKVIKYLSMDDKSSLPVILQFSAEKSFTKYEICQLFAEIMDLPMENILPDSTGNDSDPAVQRPYDCHLSTKTLKDLGINVCTVDFEEWWRRETRTFRK